MPRGTLLYYLPDRYYMLKKMTLYAADQEAKAEKSKKYAVQHIKILYHIQSCNVKFVLSAKLLRYISRRPSIARVRVASSANSRFEPTGIPYARRVTLISNGFNSLEI